AGTARERGSACGCSHPGVIGRRPLAATSRADGRRIPPVLRLGSDRGAVRGNAPAVSASRYRVLLLASHPVQYAAPAFRLIAQHPRLDVQVAYCSLHDAKPPLDHGFGREEVGERPLLDGWAGPTFEHR